MNFLDWFGQIGETIIKFFPHLKVIKSTQGGVKWRRGDEVSVLAPGLHWYWPLISSIEVVNTVRDTMDLNGQTFTTKDNKAILASGMVMFSINDVEKLLTSAPDYTNTIVDVCMTVITDVMLKYEWEQIRVGVVGGEIGKELKRAASEELRPFGVKVISLSLKDLAPVRCFKIVQDS